MPLLIILIAVVMIVVAIRGQTPQLAGLLASDAPGYAVWSAGILVVGGVGFIPGFERISRAFLLLIFVAIILAHKGVIDQLRQVLSQPIGLSTPTPGLQGAIPTVGSGLYAPQIGGGPQTGGGWFSTPLH